VARVEVEGKACLATLCDNSKESLQLHDICVYPSLWRTVLNQHHLAIRGKGVGSGKTKLRARMRGLIIFRARDA